MYLISGRNSKDLGKELIQNYDFKELPREIKQFPDQEIYIRLLPLQENSESPPNLSGEECLLIQSTPSNEALIELFLLLDLLRDHGVEKIHTLLPYLAYSRQDRRFKNGEAVSVKTILHIIDSFSDSITSINCHFLNERGKFNFENVEINNLDAFPLLGEYFEDKLEDPLVLAPDEGAKEYAQKASQKINCESGYLIKRRLSAQEVKVSVNLNTEIEGRDILLLDDMISTGGTIREAAQALRERGARSINVGCIHGVFSQGIRRVEKKVDSLVCTNTINSKVSKVSIGQLIAKSFKE